MLSEQVLIQIIIVLGSITTTYLAVKYKNRILRKPDPKGNQIDTIFAGYEKLIKRQQAELDDQDRTIGKLQGLVDKQRAELYQMEDLINDMKVNAKQAQERADNLQAQLDNMKLRLEGGVK